jgi:hypothetical protein
MRRGDPLEPERSGQRERHECLIALQEMPDRPRSHRAMATRQRLRHLGHTAVLGMAQRADQGDDIEANRGLGQRQPSFCLGPIGLRKLGTDWREAAPDCARAAPHSGQCRERALVVIGRPPGVAAGGAVA